MGHLCTLVCVLSGLLVVCSGKAGRGGCVEGLKEVRGHHSSSDTGTGLLFSHTAPFLNVPHHRLYLWLCVCACVCVCLRLYLCSMWCIQMCTPVCYLCVCVCVCVCVSVQRMPQLHSWKLWRMNPG